MIQIIGYLANFVKASARKFLFVLSATALVARLMPSAHADPVDPVHDSWQATCGVLANHPDETGDDAAISVSALTSAIANHYQLPMSEALNVFNEQVELYCPQYWPGVAVGERIARAKGWV